MCAYTPVRGDDVRGWRRVMGECREPEALSLLGVEVRVAAETLPRRLAVLLAARVAENLVERGETPCVYAGDEKSLEALIALLEERGLADRVVLVRDVSACQGMPVVALWPEKPPENLDYRLLVARGVRASRLGLRRLTVKPLPRGGYRLKAGSIELVVEERDGRLCEPRLAGSEAARVLREAIAEYGPLRLQEAVQLVAQALGLKRSEARRLVLEAAEEGLVRIEDGYVTWAPRRGHR